MRVLVCGSRDASLAEMGRVRRVLSAMDPRPDVVIHGGASGIDAAAKYSAYMMSVKTEAYPADWKAHGVMAGPIRNQRMIDEGQPDLVLAFPGGRGTEDMVRRAVKSGIEVRRV